jgi:2-polyprenyl-6-methoxyphenol hydroxylase-like FAD-dependent oxidoreductase
VSSWRLPRQARLPLDASLIANTERPTLIAGGGIGGLAASVALAKQGLETTVLERSAIAEETGAGIQLGPNATRALRSLGVLEAIEPSASRPEAIWLFDGLSGRKLAGVSLGAHAEARYGAPYLTLHRADLHAGLRAGAAASAPVSLTSDFDVSGIEMGEPITVANVAGMTMEGTSLIGADGLWSTVRKSIAPDAKLAFSRATAFRTLLPQGDLHGPFSEQVVGLWLGPDAHLVHYPVRAGEFLNVVAVTEGGEAAQGWNRSAGKQRLLSGFTRWCKESKSLLERAESWRAWSLFSLPPLPHWSRGAVTLLGDAAHPVLPYLAQGAALAIEDAVTLAKILGADPENPAAAFRIYEAARRQRTTRVQNAARRFGWFYHLQGLGRLARNAALGLRSPDAALRQFDWLYDAQT